MVSSHGKLSHFILNDEIIELLLLRPFITESHSIIVNTEPEVHFTISGRLTQFQDHFVILIPDTVVFSPDRRPCFIEIGRPGSDYFEAVRQIRRIYEFHSERRRFDDGFISIADAICRDAVFYICL